MASVEVQIFIRFEQRKVVGKLALFWELLLCLRIARGGQYSPHCSDRWPVRGACDVCLRCMWRLSKWTVIPAVPAAGVSVAWWGWRQGAPKRETLAAVGRLASPRGGPAASEEGLHLLVLPRDISDCPLAGHPECVRKAVQHDVWEDGLVVPKPEGQFGPVKDVFLQDVRRDLIRPDGLHQQANELELYRSWSPFRRSSGNNHQEGTIPSLL